MVMALSYLWMTPSFNMKERLRRMDSRNKLRLSKWHERDHLSKRLTISIALTRLRTYTTYLHSHCKTTSTICLHSEENVPFTIITFSNAVA
ncbi:hypothetical protein AVEN_135370-1 [Araneus ventricosus]|uniref:Uncharacterized protein n=1 Tax=Araneus ventricosus TaxID=182803 RepID=A0A4Y2K150_ARAVE|nr:hypothetical protein AVEN_135370-1 [Araneus ventricosus]